eukprot:6182501-Pleurochrysis_carterae.AAC.1
MQGCARDTSELMSSHRSVGGRLRCEGVGFHAASTPLAREREASGSGTGATAGLAGRSLLQRGD